MQLSSYCDKQWEQQHLRRNLRVSNENGIHFDSSDYLGLSQHPEILNAAAIGLRKNGLNSRGSAIVNGYKSIHQEFECAFAEFTRFEKAVFFSSGYMANLAIVQSLLSHQDAIYYDQYCHASLIDGLLLSNAKRFRYQHNNIDALQKKLCDIYQNNYVLTNTVFSTNGQLCTLPSIIDLKSQYQLKIIIDDAHGIGVFGKHGRGSLHHLSIDPKDIAIASYPLSKGFGCYGAMLCGNAEYIDRIIQYARTYRYSTAIPPLFAAAGLQALKILQTESWRIDKLHELIHYFKQKSDGLNCIESSSAIQAILIGSNSKALHIQKACREKGVYVGCLRPPSVARNKSLLRLTVNTGLSKNDIDKVVHELQKHV
jgi:8-amino-7-oxononanoate synthase